MDFFKKIRKKIYNGKRLPVNYNQDGLTTIHNAGFMQSKDFQRAEIAGAATGSWKNIHWRLHTILWSALHCNSLPGDFVECGTNRGGFARAICEYINLNQSGKAFYLLDTFNGLDNELLTMDELKSGKKEHFLHEYSECYEDVKKTFESFEFVKIIRGSVPDTLINVKSTQIAFLSIDMNTIVPEIAALNYFWPNMAPGGMIVLDDYAYATCDLQYTAHNEWAATNNIKILSLPTGQGIIIK